MSLVVKQTGHQSTGQGPLAITDGDIIARACASAADGRGYKVREEVFKYKEPALEYCRQYNIPIEQIEETYIPDPLSWALHSVDEMMLSILNELQTDNYQVFLTEGKNFRYDLYPSYKAHRVKLRIPEHLNACKEHLKVKWSAVSVHGIEADDAMRICAVNNPQNFICSIDKDLDIIQGWHYNWNTGDKYFVSGSQALRNFYKQMITGDTADGIPGLSEQKPKRRTYKWQPLDEMQFQDEMEWYVYCGYVAKHGEEKALEEMLMNGRLLWLLTSLDKQWEITI